MALVQNFAAMRRFGQFSSKGQLSQPSLISGRKDILRQLLSVEIQHTIRPQRAQNSNGFKSYKSDSAWTTPGKCVCVCVKLYQCDTCMCKL